MKSLVRHTLRAGVLAAGFLLFASASPAQAADQTSAFNSGVASGNNVSAPVAVAANVCGNGVGVLGTGLGKSDVCVADAKNKEGAVEDQTSAFNSGVASGNNVSVPVAVAANVCGNGVGILGNGLGISKICLAKAHNDGDDNRKKKKKKKKHYAAEMGDGMGGKQHGDGGQTAVFNSGILSGNNISAPFAAAANVCGNGIGALFGNGFGKSDVCVASAKNEAATEDGQTSFGNSGVLTGNNVSIPVSLALNVCGNGIGVLGTGIGISHVCVADASNDGDDKRKKKHNGYKNNGNAHNNGNHDGMESGKVAESGKAMESADTEVLPSLGVPLPAPALPADGLALPLGNSSGVNSPDVQLPATGNGLGLPL